MQSHSTISFSGNTINQNNSFPITATADYIGLISASTFTNVDADSFIEVTGGEISHDATWTATMPYVIKYDFYVGATDGADGVPTLTIEPGATLKFKRISGLEIGYTSSHPGALLAVGTADNPITFTSNEATPAPGDWKFIRFLNTADDNTTIMDHCVVEYGGFMGGALVLFDASPRIKNSTIRNSKLAGIYGTGAGTDSAIINCNTFTGNQNGIYWTSSPAPEMHSNNFNGNTNNGLYYTGAQILNAENNWWGDSAGSNQTGDSIYGNVDADPWSAQQYDCSGPVANEPPDTPSNPTPADAAVRIAITGGVTLTWIGGDPNPLDVVAYDLYWGTQSGSLQLAATDINGTTYTKSPVDPGTTYYWKIIAKDDQGAQTPGPEWHFTTDGDPPDLTISGMTISPEGDIPSGQEVTLTVTVRNIGSGPVVDPFEVDFSMDGASIGTAAINTVMPAGQTLTVSKTWTYTGGDATIDITADSAAVVTESDEQNNTYSALLSEVAHNTPPTLVNTSPADGAYLRQVENITATLSDSTGTVDDTAVIESFSVVAGSSGTIAGTVSESNDTFTFTPIATPLTDDTYTVNLTAADNFGKTQNYQFSFTIDTTPPGKPTITGGTVNSGQIQIRPYQNLTDQFEVELTGTRDNGTSVWVNGVEQVAAGDSDWTIQLDLAAGLNTVEVWLIDLAANRGPSQWVDLQVNTGGDVIYEYDDASRVKRITSN